MCPFYGLTVKYTNKKSTIGKLIQLLTSRVHVIFRPRFIVAMFLVPALSLVGCSNVKKKNEHSSKLCTQVSLVLMTNYYDKVSKMFHLMDLVMLDTFILQVLHLKICFIFYVKVFLTFRK